MVNRKKMFQNGGLGLGQYNNDIYVHYSDLDCWYKKFTLDTIEKANKVFEELVGIVEEYGIFDGENIIRDCYIK